MKGLVWGLFGLLAVLWSLLAWLLHGIAGAGGAAVTTVSRWLEIDLAKTQWLADGLGTAGGLAQGLVIIFWLMGMGLILAFGWMGSQAADGLRDMRDGLEREASARGAGVVLDGEIVRPPRPESPDDNAAG
jgi:hypothetical protein